jgi:ribosomal protein S20
MNLSNFRTAVADAKAMVDRGDLAAARTRLKDLDKVWDGAMARSTPRPSRVGG